MATESTEELERRLKELEREKREEELRQLKANAKTWWITPAALLALLPLVGGLGAWIFNEVKQYNEGYKALKEKESLEKEKEALQRQKDSLNIEIAALLQLKEHYAGQAKQLRAEVEAKQDATDKAYLRAVFDGSETVYALDHVVKGSPDLDPKALAALKADIKLPKESADRMQQLFQRYELMGTIIHISRASSVSFNKAVGFIPASEWARQLQPMPTGSVISNRKVMVSNAVDGPRYYDVNEGRFLTKEESKDAK